MSEAAYTEQTKKNQTKPLRIIISEKLISLSLKIYYHALINKKVKVMQLGS